MSQALAATPPAGDTPATPLLSLEQQTALVARHQDDLLKILGVYGVTVETGNTLVINAFVHTDQSGTKPGVLPDALRTIPPFLDAVPVKINPAYILPPPAGKVVVAPDGTTSVQDKCPEEYTLVPMFDWQFCMPPQYAGLPPSAMLLPPIAGKPRVDAANAVERNRNKLMKLPGVQAIQLTDDGLLIYTTDPTQLPSQVEGVPVIPRVAENG